MKTRRRPTSAEDLLRKAGIEPTDVLPTTASAPDAELRLVIAALMELLEERRERLDQFGGDLRRRYEVFRCALEESGFALDTTTERKNRAHAQRKLGELAERRGNVDAALFFYELALRSWPEIGCRRRLEWLRRHEVKGA